MLGEDKKRAKIDKLCCVSKTICKFFKNILLSSFRYAFSFISVICIQRNRISANCVVIAECKRAREFTDDRSVNRLATDPSIIQEILLLVEKSGLRYDSMVVASIIANPHLPILRIYLDFPEAKARRNESER